MDRNTGNIYLWNIYTDKINNILNYLVGQKFQLEFIAHIHCRFGCTVQFATQPYNIFKYTWFFLYSIILYWQIKWKENSRSLCWYDNDPPVTFYMAGILPIRRKTLSKQTNKKSYSLSKWWWNNTFHITNLFRHYRRLTCRCTWNGSEWKGYY